MRQRKQNHFSISNIKKRGVGIQFIFISALFFFLGCSPSIDQGQVKKEFLEKNPKAEIVDIFPGVGDSENVYMHIKYKIPGKTNVIERVEFYQKEGENWKNRTPR